MSALNEALHRALLNATSSLLDEEPLDMRDDDRPADDASSHTQGMRQSEVVEERMVQEERKAEEMELELDVSVPLPSEVMQERAKYIPLRLSYEERKALRLVMAAINVSDYTSVVDTEFKSKARRRHVQLQVRESIVATRYSIAVTMGASTSWLFSQDWCPPTTTVTARPCWRTGTSPRSRHSCGAPSRSPGGTRSPTRRSCGLSMDA